MSDVAKKYIRYVIFEKNAVGLWQVLFISYCWLSKVILNHTDDGVHLVLINQDLSYIFTFDLEFVWSMQNE